MHEWKALKSDSSFYLNFGCLSHKTGKMLRNPVRATFNLKSEDYPDFHLRPEQLSVDGFIRLTNWIEKNMVI